MTNLQLILLTIFGWGIGSIFYKLANNNIHPIIMSAIVTAVYVLMIPISFLIFKVNYNVNTNGILYSILGGLLMSVGSFAYIYLLQRGGAGQMTASVAVYPAVTFFLSFIFLAEEITTKKIIGCILAFTGIYFLN